jgi:hypothetical protein
MSIHNQLYHFINEQHWTLGFIEQPLKDIVEGKPFEIQYVKGMPRDRWFADPFILDHDDNTISVLAEEFSYSIRRGRIALLTFDRHTYSLQNYKIILDLSTHLSFPFIQRKNGKVYINPENSASGSWNRYEYNPVTNQCLKVKTIMEKPLTDAIVTDLLDKEYIFSTQLPDPNGDTLSMFCMGDAVQQEHVFSSKVARNAGEWFCVDGKVYRPAQDCSHGYGCAVIIQEVTKSDDALMFTDIRRIESTHPHFTTGCHTFNHHEGLSVVDVHGWRRPRLVKRVDYTKRILKRK